ASIHEHANSKNMKRLVICCLAIGTSLFAQQRDETKCPLRESYKSLRYDEDWSGLRNPDCRTEQFDVLKFIPMGEQAYASFGGEARLRYERYTNSGFGADPPTPSGYLLQRYLLHGDIHFSSTFRIFVQFQSGIESGRNGGPRPTDEDTAEFH